MKKFIISILLLIHVVSVYPGFLEDLLSKIPNVQPHPQLNYSDACFLTSHNSFSSSNEGIIFFNQQDLSIDAQLAIGVRGFMIDLHYGTGDQEKEIVLAHGDPDDFTTTLQGLSNDHKTVKQFMKKIVAWLQKHEKDVITLHFENYTHSHDTETMLKSVKGFNELVLTPDNWNPESLEGDVWPEIQWMIDANKRLIIFDRSVRHCYAYRPRRHITENQYGTYKLGEASELRSDSKAKKTLFVLNYFDNLKSYVTQDTSKMAGYNSAKRLKFLISKCQAEDIVEHNQQPNFIALNFVEEGKPSPLSLVQEINKKAAIEHQLS